VIEPLYVAARGVLLDALDPLGDKRETLIIAGAQAVYHPHGCGRPAVAEFTTDGDLVVDADQQPEDSATVDEGDRRKL
jgi:hypothetical protein